MLIQVEDKTIVNIRYVRSIWIYEHQYKEGEKKYLVKCEMTEEERKNHGLITQMQEKRL